METALIKLRNSYIFCSINKNNIFVKKDSWVVAETEQGVDIGLMVKSSYPGTAAAGKLLRKATDEDMARFHDLEELEEKAFSICSEKSSEKKLDMRLVSVKVLFDRTKIIFYFVSENRVDFRELVRELASVFRTRIEMRQIGVRDEARLVGGYGLCGREFCCRHQQIDFEPVSIKMAKEQNLNLNSLKISGMCGRLLCCLGYEYDTYRELSRDLPRQGTSVFYGEDSYQVISVDALRGSCRFRKEDSVLEIFRSDISFRDKKYFIKDDFWKNQKIAVVEPEGM